MPVNIENAIMNLYDDSSLTDELTDQPAKALLQWAEAQIPALAAQFPEEDPFEGAMKSLRGLLKGINRLVGQRDTLLPDERTAALKALMERAQALGFQPVPEGAPVIEAGAGGGDEQAHLLAYLGWMQPGQPSADAGGKIRLSLDQQTGSSPEPRLPGDEQAE